MGKSRLVAEVIRLARRKRAARLRRCLPVVWHQHALPGLGSDLAGVLRPRSRDARSRRQMRVLEGADRRLGARAASTRCRCSARCWASICRRTTSRRHLEPQFRKSALDALLLDCLHAAAREAAAGWQRGCCWCWRICTGSTRSRTICWSRSRRRSSGSAGADRAGLPPARAAALAGAADRGARRTSPASTLAPLTRCRGGAGHPRQAGAAAARAQGRRHARADRAHHREGAGQPVLCRGAAQLPARPRHRPAGCRRDRTRSICRPACTR